MSERGVFALDRGWFDHPSFAPEPYTEREAWAWMISEAAFKPHVKRVGSARIELSRGQLAHSLRFMAERWQWSKSRVDRFLGRLFKDTMVIVKSGTAVTVITICNYDKYQKVSLPAGQQRDSSGTAAGQKRDKEEDKEYKEEDRERGRARGPVCLLSDEASAIAGKLLAAAGKPDDHPEVVGLQYAVQTWVNEGIPTAFILEKGIPVAHKHMNYIAKTVRSSWAEYCVAPAKPSGERHAKSTKPNGIMAAIDEHIRNLEVRESEAGSGTVEGPSRVLSYRGG